MTDVYKFYREPGLPPEDVLPERWSWVAHYTDGTILNQFGDDGTFHQFKEIDQANLVVFQMVSSDKPAITIHWVPGRKLIHFYRVLKLNVGGDNEITIRLYCFGYETPTSKLIMVIMPTDEIIVLDDLKYLTIEGG